jgi:hypothetical protein
MLAFSLFYNMFLDSKIVQPWSNSRGLTMFVRWGVVGFVGSVMVELDIKPGATFYKDWILLSSFVC